MWNAQEVLETRGKARRENRKEGVRGLVGPGHRAGASYLGEGLLNKSPLCAGHSPERVDREGSSTPSGPRRGALPFPWERGHPGHCVGGFSRPPAASERRRPSGRTPEGSRRRRPGREGRRVRALRSEPGSARPSAAGADRGAPRPRGACCSRGVRRAGPGLSARSPGAARPSAAGVRALRGAWGGCLHASARRAPREPFRKGGKEVRGMPAAGCRDPLLGGSLNAVCMKLCLIALFLPDPGRPSSAGVKNSANKMEATQTPQQRLFPTELILGP